MAQSKRDKVKRQQADDWWVAGELSRCSSYCVVGWAVWEMFGGKFNTIVELGVAFQVDTLICEGEEKEGKRSKVCRWAGMEEGVRRAGGGFLIQISCGLTQQSLESKVTLGSLAVLYANRATHLASGAGLLRGYLCKSDWVRPYCQCTMCAGVFAHIHTGKQAAIFHWGPGMPCSPE